MVAISFTRGIRVSVTGSSVNKQAASAGSAEFFDPLTGSSPLNGVPPEILNLSITNELPQELRATGLWLGLA